MKNTSISTASTLDSCRLIIVDGHVVTATPMGKRRNGRMNKAEQMERAR